MTTSLSELWLRPCWILLATLATVGSVRAEVVLPGGGAPLTGNIEITQGMGTTQGGNLFHSFSVFNVLTGESVVFSGSADIHNVISRVTGGTSGITGLKSSLIDGPVTLAIPGANFYFINPNGIIFGANGSINASGSVYLSTADGVRFADGSSFYADPAKNSVLTTADPVAFGFLAANPAPIELNGTVLYAPVPPGKTLALVGGNITLDGGVIVAPGAVVDLASVASAGEAILDAGAVDLGGFAALGQISLTNVGVIDVSDLGLDSDGNFVGFVGNGASGSIYIRGGQLQLSSAYLVAQTGGDVDGGVIDLAVRGDMDVQTDPGLGYISQIIAGSYGGLGAGAAIKLNVGGTLRVSDGSTVTSESYGSGAAGNIDIHAGSLEVHDQGLGQLTGINADNYGDGAGASLTINTGSLKLFDDGFVGTRNYGPGTGGDLAISADSVSVTGSGAVTLNLSTETVGGNAGNLTINTGNLALSNGARISSSTGGSGNAGDTSINASKSVSITGGLSGIFSSTAAGSNGNAGKLHIATPLLQIDGGVIDSTTVGDGNAGVVDVTVGDLQLGNGAQIRSFSGGFDPANNNALIVGSGNAGSVTVDAKGSVNIAGSGNGRPSGLLAETRGAGVGGDVTVNAQTLAMSDAATISSSSLGSGLAGNVQIALGDSLTMQNSSIATRAATSDGGNIAITAPRLIHLVNSQITTSVESGVGGGGNIFIDPQFVVLQNSQIIANAFGGPGGNITIVAGQLIADPATVISASSALGIDGSVNIDAPDSDVSAGLAVLPESFLDAASLMQANCGAARAGLSSLVEVGRGGVPSDPDDYLSSLDLAPVLQTSDATDARLYSSGSASTRIQLAGLASFARATECWH